MASSLFIIEDRDAYGTCWNRLTRVGLAEGSTGDVVRLELPADDAAAPTEGSGLRFVRANHPCLWLTVAGPSGPLRAVVAAALEGVAYRLLADGDPCHSTTLEAVLACAASESCDPAAVRSSTDV